MAATRDPELPGYEEAAADAIITTADIGPPLESTSPYNSEFKAELQDEKGYSWLLLRVKSRSASSTSPLFFVGCDTVSGVVELDATKMDSVKAVFVQIQGRTTGVKQEEEKFLSLKETLWTNTGDGAEDRKLKGKHSWAFEFVLPKEIGVAGPRGKKGTFQLPPSFSERDSPMILDYRLAVTVKRGMLKVSQKLTTNLFYQPLTVPESPPTPLRRLAYAEGSPLPSPKVDPQGWNVLQKVRVEGVLFGSNDVEVQCQLAIATPLQYALGSPIPLHLLLESESTQALDVLCSNPAAIQVVLTRTMIIGSWPSAGTPAKKIPVGLNGAYFWKANEPGAGENRRILHGEIDLEMKLKPTFVFPKLSIEYTIDFTGFEATGWVTKGRSHGKDKPLLSAPVKITSRQLAGVATYSSAPPGLQKPAINHNKSLGPLMLTHNGFL